ncbi:MAG: IS5 family transposase [Desertimonas sp.]
MSDAPAGIVATWQSAHGDLTDDEWELVADLVAPSSTKSPSKMGRPATVDRRRVLDAIFYVTATGCQWRALPRDYPNWNTVHRLHLEWSRDGTWEQIADRLRGLVREREGRNIEPSAGAVDARSVRGAATVTSATRGFDAGKRISGRKQFGLVDTNGLLLGVCVFPASVSDNVGGIAVVDVVRAKLNRFKHLWCDAGFKRGFVEHCRHHHIGATTVARISEPGFHVLPRRWVIERTWSWIMNHRRLQVDYERDPAVTEDFIWAAHCRQLLRRLRS